MILTRPSSMTISSSRRSLTQGWANEANEATFTRMVIGRLARVTFIVISSNRPSSPASPDFWRSKSVTLKWIACAAASKSMIWAVSFTVRSSRPNRSSG